MIGIILISTIGCNKISNTKQVLSFNIEYHGRVGGSATSSEFPEPKILYSEKEVKEFFGNNQRFFIQGYTDEETIYDETLLSEDYNKSFFEYGILLFIPTSASSGSIEDYVDDD